MGFRPATLKVQVSALSSLFNQKLPNHAWIIWFIKEKKKMTPLRNMNIPSWDLFLVLNAMSKGPFEPNESISTKLLTLKTVLLVIFC